jgi:hypothetical protein
VGEALAARPPLNSPIQQPGVAADESLYNLQDLPQIWKIDPALSPDV